MNTLIQLGVWLKKAALLAIAVVCIVLIFWGILHKLFLAFTPYWLDEFTLVAVPLALVVLWLMGKSAGKPGTEDKDAKHAPAVPDAAAQLAQDEHGPASPED
jgi:hypothetical protein